MQIKCKICGKTAEFTKKSIQFYTRWLEIEPDIFVCRDCEQKYLWSHMLQYKLPQSYRSLQKIIPSHKKE